MKRKKTTIFVKALIGIEIGIMLIFAPIVYNLFAKLMPVPFEMVSANFGLPPIYLALGIAVIVLWYGFMGLLLARRAPLFALPIIYSAVLFLLALARFYISIQR